ncbi:hypothetical protein A2U01_0107943, partial [Trifolium medium]|nr:hypothetical protein [Trifolium medium]
MVFGRGQGKFSSLSLSS